MAQSAIFLTACPQTAPTAVRIDSVEVDGDERAATFNVMVSGGGFIRSVEYDLATQQGRITGDALSVQIKGNGGYESAPTFTVLSGTTLRVEVRDGPLPREIYSLAVLVDGKQEDSAPLFDLTGEPTRDGGLADSGENTDGGASTDGGTGDAGTPDAGSRDAGPPDSGLGEFEGSFTYRRQVVVASSTDAESGVTIAVPVPHGTLVTAGQSLDTGLDLAVYQGADRLEHYWADRFALNTDQLVMIVRLLREVPLAGPVDGDALVLYYGDPAAMVTPTETVFEFVERFNSEVSPINRGNDNAWFVNDWLNCDNDRPIEGEITPSGAYCIFDDNDDNPFRRTLASPRVRTLKLTDPPNVAYEMSFWLAGIFLDGDADILYFSEGSDNDSLEQTSLFATASYVEFPPTASLQFQQSTGGDRTVEGWRFPQATIQWWTRSRLQFRPTYDEPSLHWRYVSDNGSVQGVSGALLDDWWVRRTIQPVPTITLGPEETP